MILGMLLKFLVLALAFVSTQEPPLLVRAEEGARLIGVSRATFFKMMAQGRIPGVIRIGRSVRVSRESLERWVREQAGEHEDESVRVA